MPTITLADGGDTYIETVSGTGTDVDTIFGGNGADSIFSSTGDDVIYGGLGNDTISSNAADFFSSGDLVYGGEGDDHITTELFGGGTSSVADTVFGDSGNDTIIGALGGPISGNEVLFGGSGNDMIDGNGGGDFIDLGSGDDFVMNRVDEDTIDGGSGIDTIAFNEDYKSVDIDLQGGVTVVVNQDDETENEDIQGFENVIATDGNDTVLGTDGANTLFGLAGDDRLDGRAGADIIVPGTGGNSISGGEGGDDFDILDYRLLPLGVTVAFTGAERGNVTGGDGAPDTFEQIERLELTQNADFVDARLDNVGVNVALHGGDDVVQPGAGADAFYGGAGIDRVNLVGSSEAVAVDNEAGTGVGGTAEGDHYDSFESFVLTNFADVFFGGDGAETIAGAAGADTIQGGAGNDTLVGDSGEDVLDGGEGDDSINGGNGIDTISFASAEIPGFEFNGISLGYIVDLGVTGPQDTGAGLDTIFDVENAEGSRFADLLTGSNEVNTLFGGDGGDFLIGEGANDVLFGGDGFDLLEGGLGTDTLFGGTNSDGGLEADLVVYFSAAGPLLFDFGTSISDIKQTSSFEVRGDVIGDDVEGIAGADRHANTFDASEISDTTFLLGGREGDTFFGGSGTDQLLGIGGDDVIYGNDGVDALIGEGGDDLLIGGAGGDFFFFDGVREGNDVILDMELGIDRIFFSGGEVLSTDDFDFQSTTRFVEIEGDQGPESVELSGTLLSYSGGGTDSSIFVAGISVEQAQNEVLYTLI